MLGDIGDRLGGDEVRGGFDLAGKLPVWQRIYRDRDGSPSGKCLECWAQSLVGENSWMDASSSRSVMTESVALVRRKTADWRVSAIASPLWTARFGSAARQGKARAFTQKYPYVHEQAIADRAC
jgi:hypothetical protein